MVIFLKSFQGQPLRHNFQNRKQLLGLSPQSRVCCSIRGRGVARVARSFGLSGQRKSLGKVRP